MKNKITIVLLASLFGMNAFADELKTSSNIESKEESSYHAADPRNSNWRAGLFTSDSGEIKVLAGGGKAGLTSEVSQTIGFAEYYTQSDNVRFRGTHFDTYGGIYTDIYHVNDAADMYTVGYMIPLASADGTLFFPSLNYTYVDFDTNSISNVLQTQGMSVTDGNNLATQALGGDDAHLASLNLYALKPWNETHFSVFNVNMGSSYKGVEMEVVNVMWVQGIKTDLNGKNFNIMLEMKYDSFEINGEKMDEVTTSVGVDYRF